MKKRKTTIALTWWATWWHIFPLLSTYNYLKENENLKFIWVWEEEWLEFDIAMENNIKFLDIPAGKFRRYFDWRNFFEPLKNITWIFFALYFIIRYRIDVIFSKWWYVAVPLCIAGFLLWKKIYIHESDTVPGLANKIISKVATKVFYTFPNEKTLDKTNQKHIFTGQILNPEIIEWLENLNLDENMYLNVIVIAWSQGSTRIFENLVKILPKLSFVDFTIILWEKNKHFRKDFIRYDNVRCFDFISQKELWKILKQTDIAITRAWATTLWELTSFWIHSIIVPLTESAWNHQQKNAEFFKEKYWSDIILEDENLDENIFRKLDKYKNLRKNWLNLKDFFKPLQIIENEVLWNSNFLESKQNEKNLEILEKQEEVQEKEKKFSEENLEKIEENILPEKTKVIQVETSHFEKRKISNWELVEENLEKKPEEETKSNFQTFRIK